MARIRFTHRARQDLFDIWSYVAEHGGPMAADRIHDRIEESCQILREHPRIGRARPEIAVEARSIVVERWIALYRLDADDVQIVRIVDGARDLTRLEWTPE